MKKTSLVLIAGALFLSLLIKPIHIFAATTPTPVVAETKTTATAAGATVTVQPTKVEYELPYPGMLPNSPLYFLKQARDWILDKLIMDPIKKTEFYILQGDKRLAMGVMLSTSGNGVLAEQTVSKGEKYMNNAVQLLLSLKSQGKDVPAYIIDHLTLALAKHAEVLTQQVSTATDAAQKAGFASSLELVTALQGKLSSLK